MAAPGKSLPWSSHGRVTGFSCTFSRRRLSAIVVADLVRFDASPAAVAITGQTDNIHGGQTID